MWPFTQLKTLTDSRTTDLGCSLSRPSSFEWFSMRIYYDRDADTNLIKDPARAWQFVNGAVCAIPAVAIWAGWLVMMRVGVNTTLTAFDLTALRFGVAGVVLLPVVVRRG